VYEAGILELSVCPALSARSYAGVPFLAHHQHDFGVGLQTQKAIDHMPRRSAPAGGPIDLVVFIEPGLEFPRASLCFAVLGARIKRKDDR